MRERVTQALLIAAVLGAAGCVSTKVDRERIASIENLAIVAFEVRYNVSRERSSDTVRAINAAVDLAKDVSGDQDDQLRDSANWAYDRLVQMLAEKVVPKVVSRDDLNANPWYRERYVALGENPGLSWSTADGVTGYTLLEESTQAERDAYIDNLGVDAIALAKLGWVTGSTTGKGWRMYMGVEEIRPAAVVTFAVYERGNPEPVWMERAVRGCPSEDGIGDIQGVELWSDKRDIMIDAAEKGFDALISSYEEALGTESGEVIVPASVLTEPFKCEFGS